MSAQPDHERAFAQAILGGGPAPSGLTARRPEEVARRFAVYRNNVIVGLVEALATRFPVALRLVGEDFFRAMARAFAVSSPPRTPFMPFYGDAFPCFVAAFPPAEGVPYLADVMRLEAARTQAYHAADAAPLGADALAAKAQADPATWRLVPHPSLRIVASRHPIVALYAMHRPGATPGPLAREPQTALVARPKDDVLVLAAEPGEGAFLATSGEGASFAQAAEDAHAADPAFDPARALARILAHGLCAGLATLPETAP